MRQRKRRWNMLGREEKAVQVKQAIQFENLNKKPLAKEEKLKGIKTG